MVWGHLICCFRDRKDGTAYEPNDATAARYSANESTAAVVLTWFHRVHLTRTVAQSAGGDTGDHVAMRSFIGRGVYISARCRRRLTPTRAQQEDAEGDEPDDLRETEDATADFAKCRDRREDACRADHEADVVQHSVQCPGP